MPFITMETHLSPGQETKLAQLFAACRQADGSCPSLPLDGDLFFFLKEQEQGCAFAAALILFKLEDGVFEVSAATAPAARQKGYFRRLLSAAEAAAPNADFLFPISPGSKPALAVLQAIGAESCGDEHLMCLESEAVCFQQTAPNTGSRLDWPEGCQIASGADLLACLYQDQRLVASCRLAFSGNSPAYTCCLHQVAVPQPLRNQGWGFRFLAALLPELAAKGVRHFLLHVDGDNDPALALYKKAGFQISETLRYYLY